MTSTIKVDNIQNQCGANIINESSNTITIGASGDTVSLASGASQTGFGRTGTVDWVTTIQTSSPFTAVSGKGYFINTTSGAITMNLPSSPSAGDIVSFKDYARTFGSNALTVGRGGSNMDGVAADSTFEKNGLTGTLIYMDATKGWSLINDDETSQLGAQFVAATGGTITCCGNFKIHTFTGPGTFTVSSAGNSAGSNTVSYLVVAGGGGGGSSVPNNTGSGGGAGGFREGLGLNDSYTGSPLRSPTGLPVSVQAYPITVGAAGAGAFCQASKGGAGGVSTFSTITSAGGGGGGSNGTRPGNPGGSGAGGGGGAYNVPGGTGNDPPVSPPQGNNGGVSAPAGPPDQASGGGGGATEVGVTGSAPGVTSGRGGAGATTSISTSPVSYAGGGGGGGSPSPVAAGAASPCGTGGAGGAGTGGSTGTTNRGGGGGGTGGSSDPGANGGSGIVIIRYKYQ